MGTNNCLLTSLQGEVQNNSIPELGCIYFNVTHQDVGGEFAQGLRLEAVTYSSWDIEVIGDGAIADSLAELETNPKQVIHKDSGSKMIFVKNSNFRLKLTNKYNMTRIHNNNASYPNIVSCVEIEQQSVSYLKSLRIFVKANGEDFCINGLNQSTSLTQAWIFNSKKIYGDVSTFKACTALTQIRIYNTSIDGNIESLGALTSLTELTVNDTYCSGSLENFAQAQLASGRTSGSITVKAKNSHVTYQNQDVSADTLTITFNGSSYSIS